MQLSDSILFEFHMDTAGPRVSGSLAVELLRIDPREAAAAVSISWRMASTSGCLPVTSVSAADVVSALANEPPHGVRRAT